MIQMAGGSQARRGLGVPAFDPTRSGGDISESSREEVADQGPVRLVRGAVARLGPRRAESVTVAYRMPGGPHQTLVRSAPGGATEIA